MRKVGDLTVFYFYVIIDHCPSDSPLPVILHEPPAYLAKLVKKFFIENNSILSECYFTWVKFTRKITQTDYVGI